MTEVFPFSRRLKREESSFSTLWGRSYIIGWNGRSFLHAFFLMVIAIYEVFMPHLLLVSTPHRWEDVYFLTQEKLFPKFSCSWKKKVSFVSPILHIHKFSRVMHCCTYITTPAGLKALLLLRGFNPDCHLWRCFCKWRYFHHTIKPYLYISKNAVSYA